MTTTTGTTSLEDRVRAALGTVRDPELDESITDLDFVASVTVGEVGGCLLYTSPSPRD